MKDSPAKKVKEDKKAKKEKPSKEQKAKKASCIPGDLLKDFSCQAKHGCSWPCSMWISSLKVFGRKQGMQRCVCSNSIYPTNFITSRILHYRDIMWTLPLLGGAFIKHCEFPRRVHMRSHICVLGKVMCPNHLKISWFRWNVDSKRTWHAERFRERLHLCSKSAAVSMSFGRI